MLRNDNPSSSDWIHGHWEQKISVRGNLYRIWKPRMPRIDDYLKQSIFYIYTSIDEAKETSDFSATGFLFDVPLDIEGYIVVYGITNRHVIDIIGGNPVLRINTRNNQFDILETNKDDWKFHPCGNDLAICALQMDYKFDYKTINPEFLLTKEFMDDKNVGYGDDVYMIGNFQGRSGKSRNLPTVRFGNIAQMPDEPIFNPHTKLEEESFLVEMRSISGFSGSPVFLSIPFGPPRKEHLSKEEKPEKKFHLEPDYTRLLGIDWGHLRIKKQIFDIDGNVCEQYFYINSAMAGVVPSWRLEEMLFNEDEVNMRKKAEKEILEEKQHSEFAVDLDKNIKNNDDNILSKEDFQKILKRVSSISEEEKK